MPLCCPYGEENQYLTVRFNDILNFNQIEEIRSTNRLLFFVVVYNFKFSVTSTKWFVPFIITSTLYLSDPAELEASHSYFPSSSLLAFSRLKYVSTVLFWMSRPSFRHVTTGLGTPSALHFKKRTLPSCTWTILLGSRSVILGDTANWDCK